MHFAKFFFVAALAVSANALATPFVARHQHRAVAARIAAPEPAPVVAVLSTPRKRANGRCKPRTSSSSSVLATPTPAGGAANAAPDPNSSSSSPSSTPTPTSHSHSSTSTPAQETPTHKPTTSKTAAAAQPTQPSGGGSDPSLDSTIHYGDGTFYATGLGACGITNSDTDMIAAIAHANYDSFPGYNGGNPNDNPICGKKVIAEYGGKSVTVTITDRCGGCNEDALDFSPSAFSQLADQSIGRIHNVAWHFID